MSKIIINGKSDGSLKAYVNGNEVNGIAAGGSRAYTRVTTGAEPTPPAPARDYICLTKNDAEVYNLIFKHYNWTNEDNPHLEYRLGNSLLSPWIPVSYDSSIVEIPVLYGVDKVYLRSQSPISGWYGGTNKYTTINFTDTSYRKTFTVSGHIASVLGYENMQSITSIPDYGVYALFDGSMVSDASELDFSGITTVGAHSLDCMFGSCISLTTAPALPATTLGEACYSRMFSYCSSLTTAPVLPATTMAPRCYNYMFANCTSLASPPTLPAETLAEFCYLQMFQICTSITSAPELPATTLEKGCYSNMFNGCTSITTAPELPAMELKNSCYHQMFFNCNSLASVKTAATVWDDMSTENWLYNVQSNGTIYAATGSDIANYSGASGVPAGWTVSYY